MPENNLPHIHNIQGYSKSENYTYPGQGGPKFRIKERNRNVHGSHILAELEAIRVQFNIDKNIELSDNIVRDDAIYVEFISEWGFKLKFDQLHDNNEVPQYQILNIVEEINETTNEFRYKVVLMLTEGGISHFINKVIEYLNENTIYKQIDTGRPKSQNLIANIENIQRATLKAFWTESPDIPFPQENETVWWEVWFRRQNENEDKVIQNLSSVGAIIGESRLKFVEHVVRLVKATSTQLSNSLMLLDNLAELRKPQVMNDFITAPDITLSDKEEWLADLIERTEYNIGDNSTLVCILDSGVNNLHPLILPTLPDNHLYTLKEDWGKFDSVDNGGHGTGMAGLILYGDLTDTLATPHSIRLYHGLESFKIFHPESPNDPKLYGDITISGCSAPIIDRPNNLRIFCIAVTNKDFILGGRPSSSSAAVDDIAFGLLGNQQLLLISAGNVKLENASEYPDKNFAQSVADPGQSYNAVTVGSYTTKTRLVSDTLKPLVPDGGMGPANSTSILWETQWPNKPDIVMEGGNIADNCSYQNTLSLLSTHKDHRTKIFQPFDDTSAAVALASKMAAELSTEYSNYWPETIRGLMIHSADWTNAMLNGKQLSKEADRRSLLRTVGYGVPDIEKAKHSGKNSLTLISQNTIQPYKKLKSEIKNNEYHLYELPWPINVLRDEVGDKDVTLKVTLSYFIEPNPGRRQYANNFRYHSHDLDFKLIKPLETLTEFKRRISAAATGVEEDESPNRTTEDWVIKERIRNKGSIKKDFITTSGVELSGRNKLAIYPKNGWYRTLKKHQKYNSTVRYSLIVSIETEETNIDIYTPVQTLVAAQIPIILPSS